MIAIGAAEKAEELRERLASEFRFLEAEGMEVQIKTVARGGLTFIGCDVAGRKLTSPELSRRFRLYVANALSDVIVNRWEEGFLRKLIKNHYGYFEGPEQETIYDYTHKKLYAPEGKDETIQYRIKRKGNILARLTDYLEKHNELVVEGFVIFRLKEYVQELEEAVDLAVEEFVMEREQQEFINLLRCFVNVQEPQVAEIHVWPGPQGTFRLVDGQNVPIRCEQLESLIHELGQHGIGQEDFLVSALVALTPGAITIHRFKAGEGLLEMLTGIFESRVRFCTGCEGCRDVGVREEARVET